MIGQPTGRPQSRWVRPAANAAAVIPLLVLVVTYTRGQFAFDPVKAITVRTGRLAIAFLLLSLACTPAAMLTGFGRIRQARRPWGLWSLGFALLHFLAFAGWDYRFDMGTLWSAIAYQPFVLVGAGALLILAALGVSSFPGLRRKMGRSWRWVQRLVYIAAAVDVLHVLWAKKSIWEAWWYPVILGVLLLMRVSPVGEAIAHLRLSVRKRLARTRADGPDPT